MKIDYYGKEGKKEKISLVQTCLNYSILYALKCGNFDQVDEWDNPLFVLVNSPQIIFCMNYVTRNV